LFAVVVAAAPNAAGAAAASCAAAVDEVLGQSLLVGRGAVPDGVGTVHVERALDVGQAVELVNGVGVLHERLEERAAPISFSMQLAEEFKHDEAHVVQVVVLRIGREVVGLELDKAKHLRNTAQFFSCESFVVRLPGRAVGAAVDGARIHVMRVAHVARVMRVMRAREPAVAEAEASG